MALTLSLAAEVVTVGYFQFEIDESNWTASVVKAIDPVDEAKENTNDTLVIPEKIIANSKEYSVTSIGDNAFSGTRFWNSVSIPKTIRNIGKMIFYNSEIWKIFLYPHFDDYNFLVSFSNREVYMDAEEMIKAEKLIEELWKTEIRSYPILNFLELKDKCKFSYEYRYLKTVEFSIEDNGENIEVFYNGTLIEPEIKNYSNSSYYEYSITGPDYYPGNIVYIDIKINAETFRLPFRLNSDIQFYSRVYDTKQCSVEYSCTAVNNDWPSSPDESGVRINTLGKEDYKEYYSENPFDEGADISLVTVDNLIPEHEYVFTPFLIFNGHKYYREESDTAKTEELRFDVDYSSSPTKVEFHITPQYDGSGVADKIGEKIAQETTPSYADENGNIVFKNLIPGEKYVFFPCAKFGDVLYVNLNQPYHINTNLNAEIVVDEPIGPTSAHARLVVYDDFDLSPDLIQWTIAKEHKYTGKEIDITGLYPGFPTVEITVKAWAKPEDKGTYKHFYYSTIFIETPELEMTPLPAEAVSNTCAILTAETNVQDIETGCGFEWRRYDAPPEMPSTFSPCYVSNGKLAGKLHNLSPNTYYKFRPYYRNVDNAIYYGEDGKWIAFITADAYVYFEPMVYTHEPENVGGTSADLKGFVLEGSEGIIEQGFEYWPSSIQSAAKVRNVSSDNGEIHTVIGAGQLMRATVTDLIPSTNYSFRTFVRCASGYTYGPEVTFTTQEASGIFDIPTDDSINEPEIIGFWDINGIRYDKPQKGFNIIRYSDGKVRKMIIRE